MSIARNERRKRQREGENHLTVLAMLIAGFQDFLEKTPQPTDKEVRAEFISRNNKWQKYCSQHKLMNIDHLFIENVRELWKRHSNQLQSK